MKTMQKSLLWSLGIGVYVVGRVAFVNFLKAFAFVGIAFSVSFMPPSMEPKVLDVLAIFDSLQRQ